MIDLTKLKSNRGSNKKAQSMSLNVVVMAALALIILVVLLAIFGSKMRSGSKGVDDAKTASNNRICFDLKGSYCAKECGSNAKSNPGAQYTDCSDKQVCCKIK